jgi:hypothetical protein
MKTLADLIRLLTVGTKLTLVERLGKPIEKDDERTVVSSNTTGVSLKLADGKVSFLAFPKASLLEFTDTEIRTYAAGERDLTADELKIVAGRPSNKPENAKLVERDILSDGSTTYWMDKRYFIEAKAVYLENCYGKDKIKDDKVKGQLVLRYVIEGSK